MTHYYCSTFSKSYAYKGLLLYQSLLRWDKDFHFFIFCLHDEVKELYEQMNLINATIIPLSAVELEDSQLQEVKAARSDKEYIWTSKASVILYTLNHFQHIDHIVWLDGDTFFYSDPEPIFNEWNEHSIMLTEERWRKAEMHKINQYGRYNTGFMGFKRDMHSVKSLEWLRNKLIEWCYDKHENGLWSDQLYINDWLERFRNVGVIKNIGVNLNLYIVQRCKVNKINDEIYIDGQKLIFYHSYGFRYFDGNEFDLCSYMINLSDNVIRWIYLPYMNACKDMVKQINSIKNNFYIENRPVKEFIRNYYNLKLHQESDKDCHHLCTVITKNYLVQGLALYNSLNRHTGKFHLWICCVDDTAFEILGKMNLKNATLISLKNIQNETLAKIEKRRKIHEFCWTLKSVFVSYLMANNYALSSIIYIDADLFFFEDIKAIFEEWKTKSVYLTKLWLGPNWTKRVGLYSGGLIGFRRDKDGAKCLRWWKRKCIQWCYDVYKDNRWSDQKYLDYFPMISPNIKISENLGMNAGPWSIRKRSKVYIADGTIFFRGCQLICYHFSGFRVFNDKELDLCNRKKLPENIQVIYSKYIEEIARIISEIKKTDEKFMNKISSPINQKLFNYYAVDVNLSK
ncbi:MAG: hypothetical protein CVU89_01105 [Firmicutes bacterium HGW-Firmicutes-14]|nr:MAG: hypothetical protein CVU89_01105 [Firmicutes bacterium HGW-Firmicutes-14]